MIYPKSVKVVAPKPLEDQDQKCFLDINQPNYSDTSSECRYNQIMLFPISDYLGFFQPLKKTKQYIEARYLRSDNVRSKSCGSI